MCIYIKKEKSFVCFLLLLIIIVIYIKRTRYFILFCFPPLSPLFVCFSFLLSVFVPGIPGLPPNPPPSFLHCLLLSGSLPPPTKHWGSRGHCMLMRAPHLWAPYLWGGMGSSPKATQSPLGQPSCCPALTAWLMAALPREAVPCLPPDELRAFGKGDPCAFSSLCSRGEC